MLADGEFKKRKKSLYIDTSITGKHINGNIFRNLSLSWISDLKIATKERGEKGGGDIFKGLNIFFILLLFLFVSVYFG